MLGRVADPAPHRDRPPRSRTRTAAFFDLDKTIIAKSSTLAFSRSFYQGGLINRRAVLRSAYAQFVYLVGRRRPRPDGADAGVPVRRWRRGWDVQQVKEIVAETLHELIDPIIYDEAATLIEEHHLAGRDVVIVSTSGAEVVEPIGEMLGADHVIATRMVVEDGRYTGEIEYYAYGETKAEAIRELAETRGLRPDPLLRLQRLGHRPADARGGRATPTRSTRTGRCARRRSRATGRCWCSARPVRLRDRFAGVTLPHAEHAGRRRGGRRRGHGGRRVARDPPARRGPAAAAACRSRDTPSTPRAALGKEGLPALPRSVRALHRGVKHGSWAPTRRPAHVRAGEPG